MESALSVLQYGTSVRLDDDSFDRLSRLYTPLALLALALLTLIAQHPAARPVTCWAPAQFTESHRDYADRICWASNTYYLPMADFIPFAGDENASPSQCDQI